MHKLKYFTTGYGVCANDFKNRRQTEYINLQQISSLSAIKKYYLPFSQVYKGDYAVVTMVNGNKFYIDKEEYNKLEIKFKN